ncbi:glycerophosphodiester phosphodiesterase family protein [Riemerella anatipestifer]|uniref:Glycerophosphodiester phosphodiesterase family protein n=1 Tax=Riemerella anatipestifer TaxID=34085 RepID=A0AAP6HH10_RIEAN|nr:glycerophosphodiester phosphodiesterase family protein [Riemerella anatipestifer]MBT0536072.1 glycerophosphodiester phosphodiesterase family protein [Riemerella anatipestifer]MBT0550097.1 glycerophosphodiester phosphodiesterase family protein [Riemerella anatipestifer]MBT0556924.1 glycerophosphodiester phosphodiesterase family protein [Riemerella anatipestifer]MBT0560857.1 glycerophosphodiester phosphodiesterase family protein [Riemerella anatipestifer]MBT0564487.1 glycerophosphodiester pho
MKKIIAIVFLFQNITYQIFAQVSLSKFPDDKVMVVAHRADWRDAPENSIWAIRKAIEKGVDMVELDVAITKDSILILMHDKTIDRTTTGKGSPKDYTLAELKNFYLRDGLGVKTQMKIPTLEEALNETRGKVLVNLDKGFNYIHLIYPLLKKKNMLDQVLFKGTETYKDFNIKYGNIKSEILFMPIIRLAEQEGWNKINEYLENYVPYGFEFTVGETEENLIDFSKFRDKKIKVWVNALWPHHNARNHDDLALENPSIYQWYLDKKINIVQTDRPLELINFLKSKNKKFREDN